MDVLRGVAEREEEVVVVLRGVREEVEVLRGLAGREEVEVLRGVREEEEVLRLEELEREPVEILRGEEEDLRRAFGLEGEAWVNIGMKVVRSTRLRPFLKKSFPT